MKKKQYFQEARELIQSYGVSTILDLSEDQKTEFWSKMQELSEQFTVESEIKNDPDLKVTAQGTQYKLDDFVTITNEKDACCGQTGQIKKILPGNLHVVDFGNGITNVYPHSAMSLNSHKLVRNHPNNTIV